MIDPEHECNHTSTNRRQSATPRQIIDTRIAMSDHQSYNHLPSLIIINNHHRVLTLEFSQNFTKQNPLGRPTGHP